MILGSCAASFSICHANRTILAILLPLLRQRFALSYTAVTALAVSYDLGYFLTLIGGGALAARIGISRSVLLGMLVIAGTSLLSAGAGTPGELAAYRMLAGLGFSLYFTAGHAVIFQRFGARERGRALGVHTGGSGLGRLYGALLGGLLADRWGPTAVFLGFGALALADATISAWTLGGEPRVPTAGRALGARPGWAHLLGRRPFLEALALNGFCFTLILAMINFLPLFGVERAGLPLSRAAFLLVVLNAVAVVANPLSGILADRFGNRRVLLVTFASNAILLGTLPHTLTPGTAVLVVGVVGLFLSTGIAPAINHLLTLGPEYATPQAIGAYNTGAGSIAFLLNLLLGRLADAWGLDAVFTALGLLMTLAFLFTAFVLTPVQESGRPWSAA